MKLTLLCVGRLRVDAEQDIVSRYLKRFAQAGAQLGFAEADLVELVESRARTAHERKSAESAELRKRIPENSLVFALDERGKTLSSVEFAKRIGDARDGGARNLSLVIGGPDGLDPDFARTADLTLSFGRMTLPHGLVRAVLAEQIYRAATILAGHPYHRD